MPDLGGRRDSGCHEAEGDNEDAQDHLDEAQHKQDLQPGPLHAEVREAARAAAGQRVAGVAGGWHGDPPRAGWEQRPQQVSGAAAGGSHSQALHPAARGRSSWGQSWEPSRPRFALRPTPSWTRGASPGWEDSRDPGQAQGVGRTAACSGPRVRCGGPGQQDCPRSTSQGWSIPGEGRGAEPAPGGRGGRSVLPSPSASRAGGAEGRPRRSEPLLQRGTDAPGKPPAPGRAPEEDGDSPLSRTGLRGILRVGRRCGPRSPGRPALQPAVRAPPSAAPPSCAAGRRAERAGVRRAAGAGHAGRGRGRGAGQPRCSELSPAKRRRRGGARRGAAQPWDPPAAASCAGCSARAGTGADAAGPPRRAAPWELQSAPPGRGRHHGSSRGTRPAAPGQSAGEPPPPPRDGQELPGTSAPQPGRTRPPSRSGGQAASPSPPTPSPCTAQRQRAVSPSFILLNKNRSSACGAARRASGQRARRGGRSGARDSTEPRHEAPRGSGQGHPCSHTRGGR